MTTCAIVSPPSISQRVNAHGHGFCQRANAHGHGFCPSYLKNNVLLVRPLWLSALHILVRMVSKDGTGIYGKNVQR